MASAKKVIVKKKTETAISSADIAKELAKTKAYRSADPFYRDKFGGTGEMRVSRKEFVDNMVGENFSSEIKVKGKLISPQEGRFRTAAKLVAGQKWDSMNNYYKATGTKPKRMTDAQNTQFKAERKMRSDGAKPSNRNSRTAPKK
jgi:hypothetical protein